MANWACEPMPYRGERSLLSGPNRDQNYDLIPQPMVLRPLVVSQGLPSEQPRLELFG